VTTDAAMQPEGLGRGPKFLYAVASRAARTGTERDAVKCTAQLRGIQEARTVPGNFDRHNRSISKMATNSRPAIVKRRSNLRPMESTGRGNSSGRERLVVWLQPVDSCTRRVQSEFTMRQSTTRDDCRARRSMTPIAIRRARPVPAFGRALESPQNETAPRRGPPTSPEGVGGEPRSEGLLNQFVEPPSRFRGKNVDSGDFLAQGDCASAPSGRMGRANQTQVMPGEERGPGSGCA
jgi:hypothetical protein